MARISLGGEVRVNRGQADFQTTFGMLVPPPYSDRSEDGGRGAQDGGRGT
jgi:hypothetical protein